MKTNTEHINIFIAYSRKDEEYLNRLRTALKPMDRRNADVTIWFDGKIEPGEEWDKTIKTHIRKADIILLLVSIDALASDYFYNDEMKAALVRHEAKESIVIPIILRACDWKDELGHLQALPKNGLPVTAWTHQDDAYTDIVHGIKGRIKYIQEYREATKKAEQERIQKEKEAAEQERQYQVERELPKKDKEVVETVRHREGTGDLGGRKILRRPNLSSIVTQNGLIVLYICADKYGRITKAQAVKSQSTIKDERILIMAAKKAKSEMRFSPGRGTDCTYYEIRIAGVD